jgi:predicted cupin superfamily sugar epimerase
MEAQGHRAFSGTCDSLTSAGEQLKSGSTSHLVVREDNCGMEVRGSEWAIIGCRMFPQL